MVIQSAKETFYALQDSAKLTRLAKALEIRKNANTFYESFNDDKPLPYDLYYPSYAQNRIVAPVGTYDDKITFAMQYSSPTVDSLNLLTGIGVALFNPSTAGDIERPPRL